MVVAGDVVVPQRLEETHLAQDVEQVRVRRPHRDAFDCEPACGGRVSVTSRCIGEDGRHGSLENRCAEREEREEWEAIGKRRTE